MLADLLKQTPTQDILRGLEKKLLKGRRQRKIRGFVLVATLFINVLILVATNKIEYITNAGNYISQAWCYLKYFFVSGHQKAIENCTPDIYALLFYLLLIVLIVAFIQIWRSHLIRLSEDPFQYTFWVEAFEFTHEHSDKTDAQNRSPEYNLSSLHEMLHHDLIEKLSERIGRLSLLELDPNKQYENLNSHIQVKGYISLRQDTPGNWIVHIRPRIRIGSSEAPFNLTNPIKLPLDMDRKSISSSQYSQAVEWLYSSVSTEIYQQISKDLDEKIKLLPNRFLKSVALYNEAVDFMESNTIDAYNLSLQLYEKAYININTSYRSFFSRTLWINQWLYHWGKISLPYWLIDKRYHHVKAQIDNGYALCKVYHMFLSTYTGREGDPLFDLPGKLIRTIQTLVLIHNSLFPKRYSISPFRQKQDIWKELTSDPELIVRIKSSLNKAYINIPEDRLSRRLTFRPNEKSLKEQRGILFESLVVLTLVYILLFADFQAKTVMELARAMGVRQADSSFLFQLVMAELSANIEKRLHYLNRSIRMKSDFEVTQFSFARWKELKVRQEGVITSERCEEVLKEYESVLSINPGNIIALASQAYLHWLTHKIDRAEILFNRAKDVKTIIRETYIAPINYGLARLALEKLQFNRCYDLYRQALFSDPAIAIYSYYFQEKQSKGIFYYDLMGPQILERFQQFHDFFNQAEKKMSYLYHEDDLFDLDALHKSLLKHESHGVFDPTWIEAFRWKGLSLKRILTKYTESKGAEGDSLKEGMLSFLNFPFLSNDYKIAGRKSLKRLRMNIDDAIEGIEPYQDGNLRDSEGKQISDLVWNGVKSFVYNDYGNALFNYYNRFGNYHDLKKVIKIYTTALSADPNNKVIHYNLAFAHLHSNNLLSSYQHLNYSRKLDNSWIVPIHDSVRRLAGEQLNREASESMPISSETKDDRTTPPEKR